MKTEILHEPMKSLTVMRDEMMGNGRKIWLAGLGLAASAGETATDLFDQLVEKGRKVDIEPEKTVRDTVKTTVNAVEGTVRQLGTRVEETVEKQMTQVLHRFGVPSRTEVEKLIERVESLNAKLATTEH